MAVRKRKNRQPEDKAELEMTPMIDVTFLLLIFFMCASKFKTLEGKLMSHLPREIGLQSIATPPKELEELRIYLKARGDSGAQEPIMRLSQRPVADWDQMRMLLDDAVAQNPEQKLTIESDSKVHFKHVVRALSVCKAAKVAEVKFAAAPAK